MNKYNGDLSKTSFPEELGQHTISSRRQFSLKNAERLIEYCNVNDRAKIMELLSNGMDLNMALFKDCYPLRHALLNIVVNPEMVEFLLINGADQTLLLVKVKEAICQPQY